MYADFESIAGSWLLTYTLHSTLLLGLAWLVTRRPGESPARREVIWKAALVGGLVTATVQVVLPFQPLSGVVSLAPRLERAAGTAAPAEADFAVVPWTGVRPETTPSVTQARGAEPPPVAAPGASTVRDAGGPDRSGSLRGLTLALWGWGAIGGGMLLLYLMQRSRAMRGIGHRHPVEDPVLLAMLADLRRAGGVRRPIRLTRAAGLISPVALGRDEIVLPEAALTELDPAQQRCLLAHELAHLVRRDPQWLMLGCAVERLFFFQPLNRLARIRLQEAAEYLCDDWAVGRTGSGVSLATCLVKVAEWVTTPPQPIPLSGMAERRSQLVTRIHRLIEGRAMPTAPRTLWLAAGAVFLLSATVIVVPGVTAHAQQPVTPDSTVSDSTESVYRRLLRRARLSGWWAQADARHALTRARVAAEVARAQRTLVTPEPALAPAPWPAPRPMATPRPAPMPALAPMLAEARAAAMLDVERQMAGLRVTRERDTNNIAVPALIGALKDQDVEVRRAAAQALANLEDPRAVPGLIGALEDQDTEVRLYAAMALGQLEDKRAVAPLLGLLKDRSVDVRRHALGALSNFPDGVPTDAILTAMNDADGDVRQLAISLAVSHLGERGEDQPADPRFLAAFTRLLRDPAADVRQQAVNGVAEMGLKQAPADLLALEKDKSEDVRQQLAWALGRIGDPRSVPVLKNLLADQSADVREAAVHGLSEIRDRSALEALVAALRSTDPVVRRQAAQALGQRDEE